MAIRKKLFSPRFSALATASLLIPAVALAGFFVFRQRLLQKKFDAWVSQLAETRGLKLSAEHLRWTGFSEISSDEIRISHPESGLVFFVSTISLQVSLNPFSPKVKKVSWKEGFADPILWEEKMSNEIVQGESKEFDLDYMGVLRALPLHVRGGEFRILAGKKYPSPEIYLRELYLNQGLLQGDGCIRSPGFPSALFYVKGVAESGQPELDLSFRTVSGQAVISEHLSVGSCRMKAYPDAKNQDALSGFIQLHNASVQHPAISSEPVGVRDLALDFTLFSQSNRKSARLQGRLNEDLFFDCNAEKNAGNPFWKIGFSLPEQEMEPALSTIAVKEFQAFKQLSITGDFSLFLTAEVDFRQGEVRNFMFDFSENPVTVKGWEKLSERMEVQTSSSSRKNTLLKNAVLFAEDPNFYHHRGWDSKGLEVALRENLQSRKFSRGGGSLSMQLARNLWLGDSRNLSRKASEILMAFLMEQESAFSKDSILALYLSMAEWGPGIRGADAAAQFYFRKKVEELSADEACFLAILLPNPRHYQDLLNADGSLNESAKWVMEGLRLQLWENGFLSDAEFEKEIQVQVLEGRWQAPSEAMSAGS